MDLIGSLLVEWNICPSRPDLHVAVVPRGYPRCNKKITLRAPLSKKTSFSRKAEAWEVQFISSVPSRSYLFTAWREYLRTNHPRRSLKYSAITNISPNVSSKASRQQSSGKQKYRLKYTLKYIICYLKFTGTYFSCLFFLLIMISKPKVSCLFIVVIFCL